MYKLPLYTIIFNTAQTLMMLPMFFIAFKRKKRILLKTLLYAVLFGAISYAASVYEANTENSTQFLHLLFHFLLFLFIPIMFECRLQERILFIIINYFACFTSGMFGMLTVYFFKIQPTDTYGSIIVSAAIAIFYWTVMGIYTAVKNRNKLYNAKLILLLIPNIAWQIIICALIRNTFFGSKVVTFGTNIEIILKSNYIIITVIIMLMLAFINIITVLSVNSLNKSVFLDRQIDEIKVKSKSIELYKGRSGLLNGNISLLSDSLNKTINAFKQANNTDSGDLNTAIRDFQKIKTTKYSSNVLVETICAEKLEPFQDSIKITPRINIPQDMGINDLDLCRIFCNLLDNALEACADSQEKYLKIYAEYIDGVFTCLVENSNTDKKRNRKRDTLHQGLGLIILDNLAKKYNGKLTYKNYGDKFCTFIELHPA